MERAWMIASILCLIVAAIFLLRETQEAAFVSATLGVVAWLLSYRVKLRGTTARTAEAIDDDQGNAEVRDDD